MVSPKNRWLFLKHSATYDAKILERELYEEEDLFNEILNLRTLNDHEKELVSE